MSPSTESVSSSIRSRYGEDPSPRDNSRNAFTGRTVLIVGALFIILGLILTAFYIKRISDQSSGITGTMTNIERISDREIAMDFDVVRGDTSVDAVCIVTAKNFDMTEVGRREVFIPAGGEEAIRLSTTIRTDDLPVSAEVYGCSTTIPGYLSTHAHEVD